MGCNPKTKAEAMQMIASKRSQIASLQASKSRPGASKSYKFACNQSIANLRGDIAHLRAQMYSLPAR